MAVWKQEIPAFRGCECSCSFKNQPLPNFLLGLVLVQIDQCCGRYFICFAEWRTQNRTGLRCQMVGFELWVLLVFLLLRS